MKCFKEKLTLLAPCSSKDYLQKQIGEREEAKSKK
jgi:hypothetical protein